ncbi:MAG: radical SAM protein [Chitinivibrionales bacterium]|nr:radical SAM protein [Chitinivibrionales bacterium]
MEVCEIYKSLQGESTFAGAVCSFVRLARCNLNCSYCDTIYAQAAGTEHTVQDIYDEVAGHGAHLVEITGGEPLMQAETPILCKHFLDMGFRVLIETNGTFPISNLPTGCVRIVDVKTPSSNHAGSFDMNNLSQLQKIDEAKFVITDRNDFDWSVDFITTYHLERMCTLLFSPNAALLDARRLGEWILDTRLNIRLNPQLHKLLWGTDARGV